MEKALNKTTMEQDFLEATTATDDEEQRDTEVISVHSRRGDDVFESSCKGFTPETLLQEAPAILARVDQADIFRSEQKRSFPSFDRKEVMLGDVLGTGSFGVVREVISFNLLSSVVHVAQMTSSSAPSSAPPAQVVQTADPLEISQQSSLGDDPTSPKLLLSRPQSSRINMATTPATALPRSIICRNDSHAFEHSLTTPMEDSSLGHRASVDDRHYNVALARQIMKSRCMRQGEARYAVKSLNMDDDKLDDMKIAQGRIDLAIEIKYLQALNHPNIVRMRAISKNPLDSTAFFLMDRLYGTLVDKFQQWKQEEKRARGGWLRVFRRNDREFLADLWSERLVVVYDIRSALDYMHSHKMIYRDIKPENIGFDIRGDVKVFDFGLAKSLHPDYLCDERRQLYHLSAPTGSFPYMAPEVQNVEAYNEKCDVYSFGVLLYEILSLQWIKQKRRPRELLHKIAVQCEMPRRYKKKWSPRLLNLCTTCWSPNPAYRPSMAAIGDKLTDELCAIQQEAVNLSDRNHELEEKSTASMQFRESSKSLNVAGKVVQEGNKLVVDRSELFDNGL